MAWTTPRTWVLGEFITAAIMNTHVRDNSLYLASTYTIDLTDVVYSDANFTGNSAGDADWVVDGVDMVTNCYGVSGKTCTWSVYIVGSTIANSPTQLRIAVPGGLTVAAGGYLQQHQYFSGAWTAGNTPVVSGSIIGFMHRDGVTAFTNQTNTFHLGFTISFAVV